MSDEIKILSSRNSPVHKNWSDFHYWLWCQGEPTPAFEDKEVEKKYYEDLEKEWRRMGWYPE